MLINQGHISHVAEHSTNLATMPQLKSVT